MSPLIATWLMVAYKPETWPISVYMIGLAVITLVSVYFAVETRQVKPGSRIPEPGKLLKRCRFPDLAAKVSRTARDLSTELGVRLLGELTQSGDLGSLPTFAPERLATTARFFLDLVVVPMLLRSLFEVNLKTLEAEIDTHVARSVAFFLAACRHGGVS
jgi:hypothetical protein